MKALKIKILTQIRSLYTLQVIVIDIDLDHIQPYEPEDDSSSTSSSSESEDPDDPEDRLLNRNW